MNKKNILLIIILCAVVLTIVFVLSFFRLSSKKQEFNLKCPGYIDCMPPLGKNEKCEVPKGCEGKTFIAY